MEQEEKITSIRLIRWGSNDIYEENGKIMQHRYGVDEEGKPYDEYIDLGRTRDAEGQ